jgi:WD40 repeat protein
MFQAPVQPGSMDSEAGVYSMTFDHSGSRLITTDADKTIKIYKEDETAVSLNFLNVVGCGCLIFAFPADWREPSY